jgi:hypothetical protein
LKFGDACASGGIASTVGAAGSEDDICPKAGVEIKDVEIKDAEIKERSRTARRLKHRCRVIPPTFQNA